MKVNRRDLIKAGVTVLGTGALAGVAGGQEESADFDRYCAFKGPTDARDLLEPEGCAYVYLDEGDSSVYISRQDEAGWSRFTGAAGGALTWDAADLNSGTDNGVVHESTANTSYNNASLIRKGDPTAAPLYAPALELWLPLQEASGASTAHDFSGNGNDANPLGPSFGLGTEITRLRTPYFDGADDQILCGEILNSPGSGFTMMAWVYYQSLSHSGLESGFSRIMSKYGGAGTPSGGIILDTTPDNTVRFLVVDGGGSVQQSYPPDNSFEVLNENEWYHIAGVFDAPDAKVYINGALDHTTSTGISSMPDYQKGIGIGEDDFGGVNQREWHKGAISDARIYNRALSDSEVQEIYEVFGADSSHTTISKGGAPSSSPTISFASVNLPSGTSGTLEVLEDTTGDGTADTVVDTISLVDGQTAYTASGITQGEEIALRPKLSNSDITAGALVEVPVEVRA